MLGWGWAESSGILAGPGPRNRPTPERANGWMDGTLTEGVPGSCKRLWIRRRDLDESQVLVVELWEDLHGPKRLEVCGWTQFRGPPLQAQHKRRQHCELGLWRERSIGKNQSIEG